MAAPSRSGMFQLLDVLASVRDAVTKTILLVTGDNANEFPETDHVEYWQEFGLVSRPSNPDPKKSAAQVVTIRRGDHDLAIGGRDIRGQELAGDLQPGETCLYAGGADGTGQARVILKGNGTAALYTSASPGGTGMQVALNPSSDTFSVNNAAGAAIVGTPDSISITIGAAALTLNASGSIQLIGTAQVQIDGGSILLGATPVAPVIMGVTGIAGVANPKITAGT